jgi:hypothetical protein
MKTIIRFFLVTILFLSTLPTLNAQEDSATKTEVKFKAGVYYNSNLNYYGRTDSLRSSAVFPVAEIWFNKKFYINAAPVFVNNAITSFDYAGTVATAGYQAKSENEKWLTHIYLTKPFYENSSQLLQSALKAQFNTSFSWLNKIININFGGDIKLSDKYDFGLTAGVDHLFRHSFEHDWKLFVNPSAYLNAGTQRFTSTYYKKSSFLFLPGVEQQVSEEVNKLNILSYELSMPVILAKNKLQVIIIPAYVIPQNLITVQGRPDLSERGKEMFYVTAGAKYNF